MEYYNGNKHDHTDFKSEKYLQINSCGVQSKKHDYTIFRDKGRNDYLILFVTGGECEVLFDKENHLLHKGDMVIYKPFEKQRYFLKNGCSALWLHFNGFAAEEILRSYDVESGIYYFGDRSGMIHDAFITCMDRFNRPWKKKLENASLIELLVYISDARQNNIGNKAVYDNIESIASYISKNYNNDIDLEELAKKSGYSKSRFSHLFSEITNTTPIKYLNECRIRNAMELIAGTNILISEISYMCGFKDPLYFSRIFKNKTGKTPNDYRKSARLETPEKSK